MSAYFPNGTIFSLGTTYAAAKTITAVSNANPGVATSTAHGYSDADILLLRTMASTYLESKVVRVASSATNSFNLEGIDTTSTSRFPSGFGVGTSEKVTAWTSLGQVTDVQGSGGEQQFYQWTYLEDGRQRQRPTFKNARALQLTVDWDPTLSWHTALMAADLASTVYALRAALPNSTTLYYGVYVGYDGEPTITINENMKTQISFSLANTHTRY